jgi:aspartate racemase
MQPRSDVVVGVLGGMGPLATAAFFAMLTARTPATADQEHLHVVINSHPQTPDRTAFILGSGEDPRPALISSAVALKAAGATVLVIPCNTANVFADDIAETVGLPVVPWLDIAVESAKGSARGLTAILATSGTIETQVYQRRLADADLPYIIPPAALQQRVMDIIYGPCGVKRTGHATEWAAQSLADVCSDMAQLGAGCAILGCTELPLAAPVQHPITSLVLVDPAIAVIDHILKMSRDASHGL